MTAPTLTEPACPGPAEALDSTDSRLPTGPPRRASSLRRDPARDLGRPCRRESVVDAVLRLGLPSGVVGRLRARTRTRRRSSSCPPMRPPGAARSASSRSCIATRWSRRDALTHTKMRHGRDLDLTPVAPTAKAVFFGASYHADYATVLAAPARHAARSRRAVAAYFAGPDCGPWDVVDLRRLRCGDPAAEALAAALGALEMPNGWTLNVEREDVCPVVTFPPDARHRGLPRRRSARRSATRSGARSGGRRRSARSASSESTDPLADLEAFIELHQKRWGADGLFPPTPGGAQSRVLFTRLFELLGVDGTLRLSFLTVGERRIAAGIHFETARRDPVLQRRRRSGRPRALAGRPAWSMPTSSGRWPTASGRWTSCAATSRYKYEWGAVDEPIQRLLVRRTRLT